MLVSKSEKVFNGFNIFIMCLLILVFAIPYLLIVTTSLTSEAMLSVHGPGLLIREFTFEAYVYIFSIQSLFLRSLFNSVYITAVTTLLAVFVNTLCAYAISRKSFVGRKFFTLYFVFTMLFSGGMIPGYLIVSGLGLLNTLWAIILPSIVSAWNIILIRNFLLNIPDSLEESAKIDGARNFTVLFKIYFPLSLPVVATIALFTAVGQWNNWFAPLLYIDNQHRELYPVQYLLREMLNNLDSVSGEAGGGTAGTAPLENVKNAAVIVATLPIILVYPFLQKYFINGVIVGSVKE